MRAKAFTLLEVMAVIVILGLLSTATMLLLSGDAQLARRSDVLDQLSHEDRLARLAGQRTGIACVLRFDLQRQRVWRVDRASGGDRLSHAWQIPASFRIDQIFRPAGSDEANPANGTVDITVTSAGNSETYALQLTGKSGTTAQPETLWLVFAGLTGQRMLIQDEAELKTLLAALALPRADAR